MKRPEEMNATTLVNLLRHKLRFKVIFFILTSTLFLFPEIHAGALSVKHAPAQTQTKIPQRSLNVKGSASYALPKKPVVYKYDRYKQVPPDITRGNRHGTMISVTFDGGINGKEAGEILDILKKRRIKTTIFLSGVFIRRYPEITRRIVAEGHEVGNHTFSHPHLTAYEKTFRQTTLPGITRKFLTQQLKRTELLFQQVTGTEMAPIWRAPYGEENTQLRAWAFGAGYLHVGWTTDYAKRASLDSLDWVSDKSSRLYLTPREIEDRILSFDKNGGYLGGGIVLMHLGTERKTDRAATVLGDILDSLIEKGLTPVKVSEIIENKKALKAAQFNKDRFFQTRRLARASKPAAAPALRPLASPPAR